jgi:Zn-dependent protease with chaperone function
VPFEFERLSRNPAPGVDSEGFGYTTGMNLEPEVLTAILLVLTVSTAAMLALVIIPFALGNTTFSPLMRKSGMSGIIWASIAIAVVFALASLALLALSRSRDLGFFTRFTARARDYDLKALAGFMNALEGAASRAGVSAPHVTVLDAPSPNAVAFQGKDGPEIGVTSGALEAGLEYAQMEAIMAHELASVISGDYLRRPGSAGFMGAALGLLWVLAMAGILAVPIARRGHTAIVPLGVAVAILACLTLVSLWLRRLSRAREHDYILADSIAVKITGKPDAMASAIETMDKLVNRGRGVPYPESEAGLKYLFSPPHRWREDAAAFLRRRAAELDYQMRDGAVAKRVASLQESMDELSEWAGDLTAERLDNIKRERGQAPSTSIVYPDG